MDFPSGDHVAVTWRSSDFASWVGSPPEARTFHRFRRPLVLAVNTISWPSGDHDPPVTMRVSNRSSIATGFALGFCAEATVFGSVAVRLSGPEVAASRDIAAASSRMVRNS